MKFDRFDPDDGPTPELLGAYADGELCAADRAAVDAWLNLHPADAEEVDALCRLTQMYRDSQPPVPDFDTWSSVRAGIEKGLREPPPRRFSLPWSLMRFGLGAAAVAGIAVLMFSDNHWTAPVAAEPYPVVDAADVTIMSISGDDCACLVAAEPPVAHINEHDLATSEDVLVLNLEEHPDSRTVAEQRCEQGAPMMFTPPASWQRQP